MRDDKGLQDSSSVVFNVMESQTKIEKTDFISQDSYTGNCAERPSGTICISFNDRYKLLVKDSLVAWSENGYWQGNKIQIAKGINADYYHVLNTKLVKIVPKQ